MKDKVIINLKNIIFYTFSIFLLLFLSIFVSTNFQYELSSIFFKLNQKLANKDIVVIAIDEKTLSSEEFPRYEDINRVHYSKVLKNVLGQSPQIIGVDVTFFGNSENKSNDTEFKKLLEKYGNEIILTNEVIEDEKMKKIEKVLEVGFGHKYVGHANIESINNLNLLGYESRAIRNKAPIFFSGDNLILPFGIQIYKNLKGYKNVQIKDKHLIFDDNEKIPLDKIGNKYYININFFTDKYDYVSFVDVYNYNIPSNFFQDKIVFIGAFAQDIHDEFPTPLKIHKNLPGVYSHINLYNTLSTKKYLSYPNAWTFLFLQFIFIVIFFISIVKQKNTVLGMIYSGLSLIIYLLGTILLFVFAGILIEILPIIVIYILSNLILFLKKYFEEKRLKDHIKTIFSKYVSSDVVDELVDTDIENLGLGGTQRYITVFFSDLEGFTNLSESLSPENLGKILNIYFEEMSNLILDYHGTIDKYIGDAIMAFWNAPLDVAEHENLACKVAILQRKALTKIREEAYKLGAKSEINMRIGINTGNAIVGNFGSSKRYDYTALGDSINLGARLESINKQYGTKIMISEYTYAKLDKDEFITREIDLITVKGKEKPVRIYELIGLKKELTKENFELIQQYEKALNLYRKGLFSQAKDMFEKIKDPPSEIFATRCEEFIKNNPKDWDGIYRFKIK